jgi:hypothetical protein
MSFVERSSAKDKMQRRLPGDEELCLRVGTTCNRLSPYSNNNLYNIYAQRPLSGNDLLSPSKSRLHFLLEARALRGHGLRQRGLGFSESPREALGFPCLR